MMARTDNLRKHEFETQMNVSKMIFIDRFAPKYSIWNTQCGIVTVSDIRRSVGRHKNSTTKDSQ